MTNVWRALPEGDGEARVVEFLAEREPAKAAAKNDDADNRGILIHSISESRDERGAAGYRKSGIMIARFAAAW